MVFMTFSEKDPDFIKANKTWTLVTPCLFCLEMLKLCECSQRQCQAWGPRLMVMRHVFPERTHLLICFFSPQVVSPRCAKAHLEQVSPAFPWLCSYGALLGSLPAPLGSALSCSFYPQSSAGTLPLGICRLFLRHANPESRTPLEEASFRSVLVAFRDSFPSAHVPLLGHKDAARFLSDKDVGRVRGGWQNTVALEQAAQTGAIFLSD